MAGCTKGAEEMDIIASPEEIKEEVVIEEGYNHLANEGSPYLKQHATNPVDWYPWGEAAFEKAKTEDKPIFLSIGYSTCHWCHVMLHESFEDDEVAALLNKDFVAIKVDREERPDIDSVYMNVSQLMTGSGGWPLNIIMTPDKKPFYAATYIPKNSSQNRIGMMNLIPQVAALWAEDRETVENAASEIVGILQNPNVDERKVSIKEDSYHQVFEDLTRLYDPKHGGFGTHPKFPMPQHTLFMLRYDHVYRNDQALDMATHSLDAMLSGGIYDHIGYGFHRYATDQEWRLPHFEKMLYDQAMLMVAYTEAYQATHQKDYRRIVDEISTYVKSELTHPEGGFYSAQDADSEGEEGKFYLWSYDELENLLTKDEFIFAKDVFGIEKEGNYLDEATRVKTGKNVLAMRLNKKNLELELNMDEQAFNKQLEILRNKLLEYRKNRYELHTDKKILSDWNGLMIAALAKAGRVFNEPRYILQASRAYDYIQSNGFIEDQLIHSFVDEEKNLYGFSEDYTSLIWGSLELFETTQETTYLQQAMDLQSQLDDDFWDKENGGYLQAAKEDNELWMETKLIYDNAYPSPQSIAYWNLDKLSTLTTNPFYGSQKEKLLQSVAKEYNHAPSGLSFMAASMIVEDHGKVEVVLVGDPSTNNMQETSRYLKEVYHPEVTLITKSSVDNSDDIDTLTGFTEYYVSLNGKATAYICRNKQCELPTFDLDMMKKLLKHK